MKFGIDPYAFLPIPKVTLGCFVDGDEGGEGGGEGAPPAGGEGGAPPAGAPEWLGGVKDDSLRTALSGFESQDKALEAIGYKTPDWRDGIADEKLQSHAKRFNTVADLAKSNMDLVSERDRLKNTAIIPPGKDATPEEIAAYHQKLGVPETPEGYEFPKPAEGEQLSEDVQASRKAWAERFHKLGIPKAAADELIAGFQEDSANASVRIAQQDAKFAEESAAALKREWGADYDRNVNIANAAAEQLFGSDLASAREAKTSDDRLLLDSPIMLRMLAKVGREMQESNLGALTDDQRSGIEDQIATVRKQVAEAQASGDSKRANQLYQREQELLARMGNRPVVGAQGRAA